MAGADRLKRVGMGVSRVTERWVPDAWVICMALTIVVFLVAILGAGVGIQEAALAWSGGIWGLLTFTMQLTMTLLTAYACVTSRPLYRLFDRVASIANPDKPAQAILIAAIFSSATAYINWALCMVATVLFVPFLIRRSPKTDVRVLIAAAYMGFGTIWHAGLSGTVPLVLATPDNPLIAPATGEPVVDRLYPIGDIMFAGFNLALVAVLTVVSLVLIVLLHPNEGDRVTASEERIKRMMPAPPEEPEAVNTPAGRFNHSRFWTLLAGCLVLYGFGYRVWQDGFGAHWNLNGYNTLFLGVALLLYRHPLALLQAMRRGLDTAWGIIVQFPFYAGIYGLMLDTSLSKWLSQLLVEFSTQRTYPFVVYVYSAVMNMFIPAAGSKWMIEAPYLIPAGNELGVSVTSLSIAYIYGDMVTNLINPFFAIPLIAVSGVRFSEFVSYCLIIAMACFVISGTAMFLLPVNL
ncbi:MAG: TIGR00366 family protein [Gammaproteobacteria bacterium]|nr:TIGR00366 family protein [Gammaproteobacteria bacterium]